MGRVLIVTSTVEVRSRFGDVFRVKSDVSDFVDMIGSMGIAAFAIAFLGDLSRFP